MMTEFASILIQGILVITVVWFGLSTWLRR